VASVTRMTGDLAVAEDAVQEACLAAVLQWPAEGLPADPRGWLIGVARHKALDVLRREARRGGKEEAAVRELYPSPQSSQCSESSERYESSGTGPAADDELALILMCCHPALAPEARVALTLRCVCGLSTAEIAGAFLVPEPTMAKRLTRARNKVRDAGIRLRRPSGQEDLAVRLAAVLRVVYLVFTEGHKASTGAALIRGELCDAAIRLARGLSALLPDEPEVTGLLALLLLTDARRAARTGPGGELVLLADQDRSKWDAAMVADGERLLTGALRAGRPGPYQLHAAIAACHSTSPDAAGTDWRQIAALYGELIRHEPTAVVEANRAIAVAMAEGPAAGLVILDAVGHHPQLRRWPQLHVARADLLARLGRPDEAAAAYRTALELDPTAAERDFITRRLAALGHR